MEVVSQSFLIFAAVFAAGAIASFWIGRAYERSLWTPGKGLHLIGIGGEERYWIVRHDSRQPEFGSRDVKSWNELSGKQRSRALRREGPPNSIDQARRFLYEVDDNGSVTGSVGPTEDEKSRYSLSFDRSGGYTT